MRRERREDARRRGRPARVRDPAERDDHGLGAVEGALGHPAVELRDAIAHHRDPRGAQALAGKLGLRLRDGADHRAPPCHQRLDRAHGRARRATDAPAGEGEAVRRVDQRHAARERERADRPGERGVQMHELGPALADEPAQRPPRGELPGRRAPRPRERRELDARGRGQRQVGGRLRPVGVGEGDVVTARRLVGRKRSHHLERARPGRLGDMEDAHRGQ